MKKPLTEPSQRTRKRFGRLWAAIVSRNSFPCMIVVTSATESDDRESIARGLAELAQNAGRRAGYLELKGGDSSQHAAARSKSDLFCLHYSMPLRGSQIKEFDAVTTSWRGICDVVIVDIALLSLDVLGAHVANQADGVVVSVCADRRITSEDRELKALLAQLKVSVIGVVETAARKPKSANSSVPQPRSLRSLRSLFFPAREP